MAYFEIGGKDISHLVNELKVNKSANYTSQTNAAGNTVVDYINTKRVIEVGIIPTFEADLQEVLDIVEGFAVSIKYREPSTGVLTEIANCIIPSHDIEYYTIQANKVRLKGCNLKITEL